MSRRDLERSDLEELDWSGPQRSASLSAVFHHAVNLAAGAEQWYSSERRSKRRWGRALRVAAITLGIVAAVLPIVAQIYEGDDGKVLAPGWAAVALAGAAGLVALDRYFGFSGAWTRFMATEMTITRLRHDFEYAWQANRLSADDPPSVDQVRALIVLARALVLAVDDEIANETSSWISEFQTSLQHTERSLEQSKTS